jgi:hypothetical protein
MGIRNLAQRIDEAVVTMGLENGGGYVDIVVARDNVHQTNGRNRIHVRRKKNKK